MGVSSRIVTDSPSDGDPVVALHALASVTTDISPVPHTAFCTAFLTHISFALFSVCLFSFYM